jgi:PhnB protein
MMAVKAQPDGYHTITPFYQCEDADAFMEFLKSVFEARQMQIMRMPDGHVAHAEFLIGDSRLMFSQGTNMPEGAYLYLEDVDATYGKALEAGAASVSEPADQFWGDRQAGVKDRWGNMWFLATRKEDVSEEELQKRMREQGVPQ